MKSSIKYIFVAIVCALLLIPVFFISRLVYEKQQRSTEAVSEVSSKWGQSQIVAGPFISSKGNPKEVKNYTTFDSEFLFPKTLNADASLNVIEKKRGIYKINLYTSQIKLTGVFDSTEYGQYITGNNIVNVNIFIKDLKGMVSDVKVKIGDQNYEFVSGILETDLGNSGIHFTVEYNKIKGKSYDIEFTLNGSNSITFAPIAKTNHIALKGNWPDPSFGGSFLPTSHQITSKDFKAEWQILSLNKSFPQYGKGSFMQFSNFEEGINYDGNINQQGQHCLTRLFNPVTDYVKARRANQYAFFLLIIVFVALFMSEYISKSNIHLIQYAIIGFAIVLFYLFLLALSEHIGFNKAYLVSALLVVIPTFFYTKSILNNLKAAISVSGLTMLLYCLFFIMLLSQDYSLLIGSVLAFILLISVMYITRNFNKKEEPKEIIQEN